MEAARRWGHVNVGHLGLRNAISSGGLTAADPGLCHTVPGWALAFSRLALASIGYFDLRLAAMGMNMSICPTGLCGPDLAALGPDRMALARRCSTSSRVVCSPCPWSRVAPPGRWR